MAPSPQQPTPLILSIAPKPGLFTKDLQISDPRGAILYTITGCKSDIWSVTSIFNAQTPTAAQVVFHGRLRAEVNFPGRAPVSISLTGGLMDNGYSFPSGMGMGMLMWSGGDSKRVLTTASQGGGGGGRGQWVARYEKAFLGQKAKVEVADGRLGVGALDEVVVTGVAVAEVIRRRKNGGG